MWWHQLITEAEKQFSGQSEAPQFVSLFQLQQHLTQQNNSVAFDLYFWRTVLQNQIQTDGAGEK